MYFSICILPILMSVSVSASSIRAHRDDVKRSDENAQHKKIKLRDTQDCLAPVDEIMNNGKSKTDNDEEKKSNYYLSLINCNDSTATPFSFRQNDVDDIKIVSPGWKFDNYVLDAKTESGSKQDSPDFGLVSLKNQIDGAKGQRWVFDSTDRRIYLRTTEDYGSDTHCLSKSLSKEGGYLIQAEKCKHVTFDKPDIPYILQEWELV